MTIDRAELRRLCEAATPVTEDMIRRYEHGGCRVMRSEPERDLIADFYTEHDRECWIAARTALPALLDALEAAEARERKMREHVTVLIEVAERSVDTRTCSAGILRAINGALAALAETAP